MRHHDLVVIGTGSGNMIIDDAFADLDVALVEQGIFGGTCPNVGCVPSKMLAWTAEQADRVREAPRFGVDAHLDAVRWPEVRDRIFGRLDRLSREGRAGRAGADNVTFYAAHVEFTGPRTLRGRCCDGSGTVELAADRVVIAAGSRPVVPPPVAQSGVPYETSDTVMRIDAVPRRLGVLGGGYIAAELAQVFSAFGSEIVIVEQVERLLSPYDEAVSDAFTELAGKRFDVRLGRSLTEVTGEAGALRVTLDDGALLEADMLLVATGRTPNSDRLGLDAAGIRCHEDGRIAVDAQQRTSVEGVFALGDVCSPLQLKHVANHEAQVVRHNLLHPDDMIAADHAHVPTAVFTNPQIAAVGRTERECREAGDDYVVACTPFSAVAYGWAIEDTVGFCKILAERGTGRLLGAHIMGDQASTLIQPLVLAMACGIDARTVATRPYWIHPALTEVVEVTLQALDL